MRNFLKNTWVKAGCFVTFVTLFVLSSTLHLSPTAEAGVITFASEPLATSNGLSVKPNLLFILDNSGSMAQHYTADYINTVSMCNGDNGSTTLRKCTPGDPAYSAPEFNYQYYDPTTKYDPPKDYLGVDFANATPTAAIIKPFTTSGSSIRTVDLTSSFVETYWCKNANDVPSPANTVAGGNCVKHNVGDNYKYPDSTYKYKETNGFWCKNASDNPLVSSNCVRAFNDGSVWDNDSNDWDYSNTYSYFKTSTVSAPYYYNMPSDPMWCNYSTSAGYTSCVNKRNATQKYPRFIGASAEVMGVRATAQMTISTYTNSTTSTKTVTISGVTVNGVNLLNATITTNVLKNTSYTGNQQATAIVAQINAKTSVTGFAATLLSSGSNVIVITAPYSTNGANSDSNTDFNGLAITTAGTNFTVSSKTSFSGAVDYKAAVTAASFAKVEIIPTRTSYPKYADRIECATSGCTYAQELQNFANWFQYYKTRMESMKTSTSRVFAQISDTAPGIGFRVGFRVISAANASEVQISEFNSAQKQSFFTKLFATLPTSSTPLRAALSAAGRLYGNKYTYNPVTQSCQQNFTFLSTDGYWNNNDETTSYGPYILGANTAVGNQDGTASGEDLPQLDGLNISSTLADVAEYYWKTDLRPDLTDNVPTSSRDSANWQHMVTFTLGLGVPGNLEYSSNYLTGGSTDYNNLLNEVSGYNWGDPITNTAESRIDDLWHAAVNGRGIYFSAKKPREITQSLVTALNSASAITGSGAAAATSNLEPVAGDNFAYTASYTTKEWIGNLKAQTIDLTTGAIDGTITAWDAQSLLDAKDPSTRVLYTFNSALSTEDKKMALTWTNIQAKSWTGYFDPNNLTQCQGSTSICSGHTNQNLFEYMIGGNLNPNGSYRTRTSKLGDIVNSQPVYVGDAQFGYQDTGYATFVANQSSRRGQVYVGANDGFLHALDAATGEEKWAYAPANLLNSVYKIADNNYVGNHLYFVDGKITVGDIFDGTSWRTILVGGLGAGGKMFYGLDITNPDSPKMLWEFTNSKMGYSFGNPLITKLPDGTWNVILTSGYNSTDKNQLFVLNPVTGALKYSVPVPASTVNAGMAKIANWVVNATQDNTTGQIYGGDLDGNIWRFVLGNTSGTVTQFAALGEPITVKPTISAVTAGGSNVPVVLVGTGQFLQNIDKADTAKRAVYALKDDGALVHTLIKTTNVGGYVQQTLTAQGANARTSTNNNMDWSTKKGWFVNLLDDGERVNVDPKLQLGTFIVPSNVPSLVSNACSAGGYAWINYFDVLTGSYVKSTSTNPTNIVSTRVGNALVVGINVVKLPNGKLISIITTSDNSHPVANTPSSGGGGTVKRVSWRELITE